MKRILGLEKTVLFLGLVSLFTDLSSEMIYPILPLFLANVIGASTVFIGLIEGVAEATASFLKVFSGWLSDRLGRRRGLILAGYGLSSITKPLLALATSGWHVLGLRFADRVGKGIRGAPRDALIADITGPDSRGRAFGFHRAMDTMGAILGPLAAFLLLPLFDHTYRPLFLVAAVPALIAVGIIVAGAKEKRGELGRLGGSGGLGASPPSSSSPPNSPSPPNPPKIPRQFLILLVIFSIFTLGNSSDAFLILRSQGIGVKTVYIPLLWLLFNATYTLVSIPAGVLSDKIGRRKIIVAGFTIYALSYSGFAVASSAWHAWGLFALYGLYYGTTEGVVRAYVADMVPAGTRATAFGIYNFTIGILLLPANLLTGWLWKAVGPQAAFGLGAALAAIAAMLLIATRSYNPKN